MHLDLDDPAQRRFADYELLECIGEGGMGLVYRARHLPLDRIVALKLLSAGPWASPEFIARFEREAQNAARMQHPNIVTVFAVGSHEGLHFFSMRLVAGQSLAAVLRRDGRRGPRAAAALLHTIAGAVAYAHSLGVLHLDLKPGNVLIDAEGAPHVTDFGLARRLEPAGAVENDEVSGTPAYMAPEQTLGQCSELTAATDVWALGAMLYELLTGAPPFRAQGTAAVLRLVRDARVPAPRRRYPDIPRDLEAIALRCLQRDPAARYASAQALAEDLARFLEGRPVRARPLNALQHGLHWARREPLLAAATLAAAGLLGAGLAATTWQWQRAEANARIAQANAASASERLWDSRRAAALAATEARNDWDAAPLLLANLAEMEARGDAARAAAERRRLGILRHANPTLVDAIRVQARPVAIAFDPQGTRLAVSGEETGLRVFDAASGRETLRTPPRAHEVLSRLHFSADGRTLIGTVEEISPRSPRPAGGRSLRLDVERGGWLEPPRSVPDLATASYDADGRFAVLTTKDRRAQVWATDPWRPIGPTAPVPYADIDNARLVAGNGSFFVLAGPPGAVTLVDARSMRPTRLPLPGFGAIAAWAISPDSRWIALGDFSGRVVVVDSATHATRMPQPHPGQAARWLTFSADGGWLALAARAGGVYLWSWPDGRLLAPPFSGSSPPEDRPLAEEVALDRARGLVLVADGTGSTAIWQVAPASREGDAGEARRLTAAVDSRVSWGTAAVAWNPEAGWLASIGDQRLRLERIGAPPLRAGYSAPLQPGTLRFDGRHLVTVAGGQIRIRDVRRGHPLGAPVTLPQPPGFAELTPDGATLVAIAGRTLHAFDAGSGQPRFAPVELRNTPTVVDLSPDGRRIAIGALANESSSGRTTSEMVVIHSLVDGRRLAGPVALPGPTNETLAFSPDGSRLLAWNPRELALRDGMTLAPVAGPLADYLPRGRDPDSHRGFLAAAAPTADGGVALIHTRNDGSDWLHELVRYPRAGAISRTPLPSMSPSLGLLPLPPPSPAAVVSSDAAPLTRVVAGDGASRELPDPGDETGDVAAAVSADGRWLARMRRDGVALFDLQADTRITTLHVALPRPDRVQRLAFSPDGNHLLARSLRQRQLVWDLTPDARPVAAIARELELRDVRSADPGRSAAPARDADAAKRESLRAGDPGPPDELTAGTQRAVTDDAIPRRDPATPSVLLDLTPHYAFPVGQPRLTPSIHGDFSWLPAGIQRFQDVDYDVRGGFRLERGRPVRIELGAPPRGRRFAALDVLVALASGMRGDAIATLTLHYVDGRHADVALDAGGDALAYWRRPGPDAAARFATYGFDARTRSAPDGRDRAYVLALRVANPRAGIPVSAVTLEPAGGDPDAAPAIFAITLEAEADARVSRAGAG